MKIQHPVQAARGERGEEVASLRTKPGSRIAGTGRQQDAAPGLHLGKIFDTLTDASLKCFLQRKSGAGNADQGTARVQRVRNRWMEFGPKRDQAGASGAAN
jgi:hypothetical protein